MLLLSDLTLVKVTLEIPVQIILKVTFSKGGIGQRTTHRKVGLISNLYSKE